jgi:hypothetical protein
MILTTCFCGGTLALKSRSIQRPINQLHETTNTWLKVDSPPSYAVQHSICRSSPAFWVIEAHREHVCCVTAVMYCSEKRGAPKSWPDNTLSHIVFTWRMYSCCTSVLLHLLVSWRKTVYSGVILLSSCQVGPSICWDHVTNADIRKNGVRLHWDYNTDANKSRKRGKYLTVVWHPFTDNSWYVQVRDSMYKKKRELPV